MNARALLALAVAAATVANAAHAADVAGAPTGAGASTSDSARGSARLAAASSSTRQLKPLSDAEMSDVRGGDSINFALHLELNQHPADPATHDSRIAIGQVVDGRTTWVVMRNPSGVVDMVGLSIGSHTAPDGTNYVAVGMPAQVKFDNFGFESLSVQQDPSAPVTDHMGSFRLNGSLQMQGQLRTWAH
ncbi:hypothetical protein E4L96_16445 [Massilia arenosa]|uniref:Uncharacterized protein n=1 Tax=Zemynaea arenosa TaxID=2561931 RepID=A0A4Y9S9I0_9BURK|nr:hypothetical protein [Massilia arenosa]TFW16401.1 hypothetical protein E4L96_16445 [Massilia arenosa]